MEVRILSSINAVYFWIYMKKILIVHNEYQKGKYVLGLQWEDPQVLKQFSTGFPWSWSHNNSNCLILKSEDMWTAWRIAPKNYPVANEGMEVGMSKRPET